MEKSVLLLTMPSFLAISIKLWLIFSTDKRELIAKNWPILIVFIGTGGTNFIELFSYLHLMDPGLYSLKMYYLFLSLTFIGLLLLSISNSGIKRPASLAISSLSLFLGLALITLIFNTNLVIAGLQLISYSITRVPGEYYWFFQAFAGLSLGLTIALNWVGCYQKTENAKKCKATLLCFAPYSFAILIVIGLMQINVSINAALIIPLTTTYLLLIIIFVEDQSKIFSILIRTPFSKERNSYKSITSEIEHFLGETSNGNKASLKELTSNLEKQIVSMAIEMSNGSQVQAASLLNTSKSSICRKNKL
ncbi:hypothetical protein OAP18_02255 [Gammaproteobacteria bacterium]|nr:hypothetical protein [Gammaproteobacteria bacterium]